MEQLEQLGIPTFERHICSSKCEIMSVHDLKDAFHSLRLAENSRNIVVSYLNLEVLLPVPKNAYGSEHLPSNLAIIH